MTHSLIKSTVEERKKKDLQERIEKQKKKLVSLITKCELLRVELDMIRQEYTVRVGQLFHKSNQQDLDIIYYRNLIELLEKGYTYSDAVKKLDDTYYAQQHKLHKEREQMQRDQKIYEMRIESADKSQDPQIKNLWKQLVSKFHPDLVQDQKEKSRREEMMKLINRAYQEKNMDTLKKLQNNSSHIFNAENTIQSLENILVEIENQIIEQEEVYEELKTSEWYHWRTTIARAKKKNQDVFIDIEHNLLNEIVKKMELLEKLKQTVEQMRETKHINN